MSKIRDTQLTTYAMKHSLAMALVCCAGGLLWVYLGFLYAVDGEALKVVPCGIAGIFTVSSAYSIPPCKLSANMLSVGRGPLRVRIPLARIESVASGWRGARHLLSWSSKSWGLVICQQGRRRQVFISLEDHTAFLQDLAQRCPQLELRDSVRTRIGDPAAVGGLRLALRDRATPTTG